MSYFWHFLTAPFRLMARWPARLVGAPQRLMGVSLPARVAILAFIFLLILILTAFTAFYVGQSDPNWHEWWREWIWPILLLAVVIPVLTYFTLRMWLEAEVAEFPDIEQAWREGLKELTRQGIDLQSAPLFLVLGVHDAGQADALMTASEMRFRVSGFPDRRGALRWYGREDAVFLFCMQVGLLSGVQQRASEGQGLVAFEGTEPRQMGAGGIGGTLTAGAVLPQRGANIAIGDSFPSGGGASMLQGTLMPGVQLKGGAPATGAARSQGLSPGEAETQAARLRFLCRMLNKRRQPFCPLNGVLAIMAWPVLDEIRVAEGLGSAARTDLNEVYRATELTCPVTLLVAGMEQQPGFAELVRRVGGDKASQGRFGKGFDVWNRPSAENLDALSSHACGAFEDWVYSLFREPQALQKTGNGKLYGLMCKIRGEMQIRIRNLLVRGFSLENSEPSGLRISGCYFAATGSSPDQQAFVKSTIHKMVELEGELDWAAAARSRNSWLYRLARVGMVVDGLLFVAVIAMLVYHFGLGRGGP